MNQGFWICPRCVYQEPVSKYKQSQTRFCPKCFADNRNQIPMRRKEGRPPLPMRSWGMKE